MAPKQSNDKIKTGYDNCLLSLPQRLPISELFAEEDIAESINTDEHQEIRYDMIEDMVENREKEEKMMKTMSCRRKWHIPQI